MRAHPDRFGLLAALPTNDPGACLTEIQRVDSELRADGFAVQCLYNDVSLSDPTLEPVWAELDARRAVVFAHPNAYGSSWERPAALIEVAFQTAQVFTDLLYQGIFRRYPAIRFVVAHCGGALPVLAGRLSLLGTESWIPNPQRITTFEIEEQLGRLHFDTAATMPTGLAAALLTTSRDHIVYGSDCGVPCTTEKTMNANLERLLAFDGLDHDKINAIGKNAFKLFPAASKRVEEAARHLGRSPSWIDSASAR